MCRDRNFRWSAPEKADRRCSECTFGALLDAETLPPNVHCFLPEMEQPVRDK
jgi:hypothetical protein